MPQVADQLQAQNRWNRSVLRTNFVLPNSACCHLTQSWPAKPRHMAPKLNFKLARGARDPLFDLDFGLKAALEAKKRSHSDGSPLARCPIADA